MKTNGRPITFGSFCSGIGAPESAWLPLGWVPKFFAEIEPFPSAVLAHHYPAVPNVGDMTEVDTAALPDVDLWVAGTPCQAFSVAGLRKSLDDDRGNLTLTFCRMVHERDPAIVVWENVPGVLNTKDNAFGCFLAGLVGEGEPLVCGQQGWRDAGMAIGPRRSAAWRVLDAQYVGLAQRRRRVFVVSFRTGDGHNPGAVLFEPESLPRDTPPGREAGAGVAGTFAPRTHGGGGLGTDFECDGGLVPSLARSLLAKDNDSHADDLDTYIPTTTHTLRADGFDASEDGTGRGTPLVASCIALRLNNHSADPVVAADGIVDCIGTGSGHGGGGPTHAVAYAIAIQEDNQNGVTVRDTTGSLRSNAPGHQPCGTLVGVPVAYNINGAHSHAKENHALATDIARCLDVAGFTGNQGGTVALTPIPFDTTQLTSASNYSNPKPGDPCHPLAAGAHVPAVAFTCKDYGADAGDLSPTLRAMHHDGSRANGGGQVAVAFTTEQTPKWNKDQALTLTKQSPTGGGQVQCVAIQGNPYAGTYEADASSVLSTLRREVGAEAVAEWGSRILDSLQRPEVLRAWLHGGSLRLASDSFARWVDDRPLPRTKGLPGRTLLAVWKEGPDGRSPQGRGLAKQLAHELGTALSGLPSQTAPETEDVRRLRGAAEGARLLRQALSEIQAARRPAHGEGEPARTVMAVRRLLPVECEKLQGFPPGFTAVPYRGKPAADGPRYRALGNSMAVPVVRWIGDRIAKVLAARSPA